MLQSEHIKCIDSPNEKPIKQEKEKEKGYVIQSPMNKFHAMDSIDAITIH